MGIENLVRKGQKAKSYTIKKLVVPGELAESIRKLSKVTGMSFSAVLLELADEGAKAWRRYDAARHTPGADDT